MAHDHGNALVDHDVTGLDDGSSVVAAIGTFLERQAGLPFCGPCLAYEAGLERDAAWPLMRRLTSPRFARRESLCARCVRERLVVSAAYHDGGLS